MGSMSAEQEAAAAQEAAKLRAMLEAAGYDVGKCQPFDAGAQIGVLVWLCTPARVPHAVLEAIDRGQ